MGPKVYLSFEQIKLHVRGIRGHMTRERKILEARVGHAGSLDKSQMDAITKGYDKTSDKYSNCQNLYANELLKHPAKEEDITGEQEKLQDDFVEYTRIYDAIRAAWGDAQNTKQNEDRHFQRSLYPDGLSAETRQKINSELKPHTLT